MKNVKKVNEAKESAMKDIANDINLNELLNEFKTLSNDKANKVSTLYKDAIYLNLNKKERKSLRMKLRRKRNAFAKDIIAMHKAKKVKERNELIKTFNSFYKTFYKLNDLSFNSLSAKNNDDDTFILINEMLQIIKKVKVK